MTVSVISIIGIIRNRNDPLVRPVPVIVIVFVIVIVYVIIIVIVIVIVIISQVSEVILNHRVYEIKSIYIRKETECQGI